MPVGARGMHELQCSGGAARQARFHGAAWHHRRPAFVLSLASFLGKSRLPFMSAFHPDWLRPAFNVPGVDAVMTTRRGGVSASPFDSMNVRDGLGDEPSAVARNQALLADAIGVPPLYLNQVHGCRVVRLSERDTHGEAPPIEADASVTTERGIACAIQVADCLPVLMAVPGGVAAAHAGWRGAQAGVLEATVDAMLALGAKRANIAATIGPTISQKAYEVGPEFFETFTDDDPFTQRFFAQGQGDRMLFDLPAYGLSRLRAAGVAHAEWTRHCTYGDPARFYSFRRTTHAGEADYGRLISVIRL